MDLLLLFYNINRIWSSESSVASFIKFLKWWNIRRRIARRVWFEKCPIQGLKLTKDLYLSLCIQNGLGEHTGKTTLKHNAYNKN